MVLFSPKVKRDIARVLPFGFIWLVIGWTFMINDVALTRNQNLNPDTDITLTPPVFIFASVAIFLMGLLIGILEMVAFEKLFTRYSLPKKIITKLLIYAALLFCVILITFPLAESIVSGLPPLHPEVLRKLARFLTSVTVINTGIQLAFELLVSVIYAAISENLGHNVLRNLFTGKYSKPLVERRAFMFLDMKKSTSIAEQLGHEHYFRFLRTYYESMSDSIIRHYGEVYQYVGDEVVITWSEEKKFSCNHILACYFDLKKTLKQAEQKFLSEFGVAPDFRAGIHLGEVSGGEIGALKKEIVYTGDVLNTAARLQNLGKEFKVDLIFSEAFYDGLEPEAQQASQKLDRIVLRGKSEETDILTIHEPSKDE
ncbi:MAG: adenylate/guanylate cyclase domain-containing protein [Bacteroidota bacterium]